MKALHLILIGFLLLSLSSCSDLLGNKELVAELKKNQNDAHCRTQNFEEMPDSCHPIFVVDGEVVPQGDGSSHLSSLDPSDIANIEVIKDSSNVPLSISSLENYGWETKFRGIVLITTKSGSKK